MYAATASAINPDHRAVSGVYKPRNPAASHYFQCISAHWEELEPAWDVYYQRQYGFFRSYVKEVMLRFLDCGDLHNGFARVRCHACGHEYLLAFSCKRRHFCPSCHQKRVVEFGEWLCAEVLKSVPHRQWVFSIPKRLRPWFSHDRKLLAGLSKCAWKILGTADSKSVPCEIPKGGSVAAFHRVNEVDPLLCLKCQGQMKIISFIEEQVVIKQILQHLGLWEIRNTGPPKETHLNVVRELTYQVAPDQGPPDDGFFSQVPNYGYWAE